MKPKFSLLAVLMVAVTLALVGVLRDINTSKALIPDPVQPFLADATGGMADTTLGKVAAVNNYTITNIPRGSRTTLPWIYSGPGWELDVDKNMTDEEKLLGTVFSYVDALCDSADTTDVDILQQTPCNPLVDPVPLVWRETTTAVEGTGSEFLKSLVPPYSWLARHTSNIHNICLYGKNEKSTESILNTVYTSVPFAPNGSAFTATTKLGGDPVIALSDTCLDSPQSSTSITSLYHAPYLEGDADGPCNQDTYECADAAIYGVWTDNTVRLAAGATTTKSVKSVNLNNGPETGAFSAHWEVELTNPTIMDAGWTAGFAKTADISIPSLAKSVSTNDNKDLYLQCKAAQSGEGLVVLKKILWPVVSTTPGATTRDTYADDNAFVFVVRVVCAGAAGSPPVDKEVIWVKPVPVEVSGKWYAQDHLVLAAGETRAVIIDELKANHGGLTKEAQIDTCVLSAALAAANSGAKDVITATGTGCDTALATLAANETICVGDAPSGATNLEPMKVTKKPAGSPVSVLRDTPAREGGGSAHAIGSPVYRCSVDDPVDGKEWLVAEVADENLVVTWEPNSVTIDQGGTPVSVPGVTTCGDGCITYTVTEPLGQSDIQAQLNIQCAAVPVPGLYSVVLKAIDAPLAPYVESKPSDNAQRSVIKVWCGAGAGVPDGKEDANGLYARWTVFQSVGTSSLQIAAELRKSYKSPPSFVSDTGYVERLVDLQCFWMDNNGCYKTADTSQPCNSGTDAWIDENESWLDYDLVHGLGGIDAVDHDRDCLMAAGKAQPSHPVDELDEPTGTNCATGDGWVVYSEAPNVVLHDKAADQDCDGLVDGIEKAWGSNDQLADSDSDGAKDFVEIFQQTNPLNPDTDGDGFKDAPVPTYLNSDTAYDNCPGVANAGQENNDGLRRPNGSVLGDGLTSNPNQDKMGDACDPDDDNDGAPDAYEVTTAGSDPTKIDSDGDTVNDGAEIVYKTDPMVGGSNKPSWSAAIQQKYYRGCHHNLPAAGTYGVGYTNWDAEYDAPPPPYIAGSNDVEMDIDGDGLLCGNTDKDSDNGTGTGAAAPVEIEDSIEQFGYALGIANKDTDGDGCEDWIEIVDLNGSRQANIADVLEFNRRAYDIYPPSDSDVLFDVNRSGSINVADALLAARNSSLLKPHPKCGSEG
jgi:hypothetical protein